MKKLTARNSTFLHNAKLMFGAPACKRIQRRHNTVRGRRGM